MSVYIAGKYYHCSSTHPALRWIIPKGMQGAAYNKATECPKCGAKGKPLRTKLRPHAPEPETLTGVLEAYKSYTTGGGNAATVQSQALVPSLPHANT